MIKKCSTCVFISLLILVSFCFLLICYFNSKELPSIDRIISVIGLIVTAVSLGVAGYFILLAVSAYSHFRDIESIRSSVFDSSDKINKQLAQAEVDVALFKASITSTAKEMVDMLVEFIGHQVYCDLHLGNSTLNSSAARRYLQSHRNNLLRQRALLALKYKFLDSQRRERLVRELGAVGKLDDLPSLKRALEDESEDHNMKLLIKEIIKQINIRTYS